MQMETEIGLQWLGIVRRRIQVFQHGLRGFGVIFCELQDSWILLSASIHESENIGRWEMVLQDEELEARDMRQISP